MRLQNLDNRAAGSTDIGSQLRAKAQTTAKSFNSGVSSAFGKTLSEFETSKGTSGSAAKSTAFRQDLVATVSNSRATLASGASGTPSSEIAPRTSSLLSATPATAAIVTTSTPASTGTSTVSGLQGWIEAADQTASAATPATTAPNASPTPAAPPTLYATTQGLSTDPTVFTTQNYSEQLLYSSYVQQANNENSLRYQNYTNEFQNWQLNGSQGKPPDAPVYETIDQNAFGQWYTQMTQNYSQGIGAPDVSSFMANGPDYGNGYYGAVGTSQVGTLYNPTGPATPAQISAANGNNTNSSSGTNT